MFCCHPQTLTYSYINLDLEQILFQQEDLPLTLTQKFKNRKGFLYLPKTQYFPSYAPSIPEEESQSRQSNGENYEMSFSWETNSFVIKELVQQPRTKFWRVLLAFEKEILNENDQFSFGGLEFQVYSLPKKVPNLSREITQLSDPQQKCRICLGNETSEHNPLLNFCKCSGSIKYMHLQCCRQWIQEGSEIIEDSKYEMNTFYNFKCNICNEPWKNKIKHNKIEYLLYDFEPYRIDVQDNSSQQNRNKSNPPSSSNIIFCLTTRQQDYQFQAFEETQQFSIFKLKLPQLIDPQNEYSFTMGRSSQLCNIVFMDYIITSPIQCKMTYCNNKLYIKDMNSYCGTNVLLKNSKKTTFNTKEGLYLRNLNTVYQIKGERYFFSCFQPEITYQIKYIAYRQKHES